MIIMPVISVTKLITVLLIPDARLAVKPGKPRNLVYNSNLSVDTANHVITNIQADHSDKKDSRYLHLFWKIPVAGLISLVLRLKIFSPIPGSAVVRIINL